MLSNLIARLTGAMRPAAQVHYDERVHRAIREVRACDSLEPLIDYLGHYNGYVREAAIGRAVELGAPALLPALVVRA